jgi:hypothetical protein
MNLNSLRDTPPWEWPADAGKAITRVLADRRADASERNLAANPAGELAVMDDRIADQLLSIVQDAEEADELRARAATSLGPVLEEADMEGYDDDIGDPPISLLLFRRLQAALRKLHDDEHAPALVRRRALEASVRSAEDWHTDAIRAAFLSGDEDWKLTAVFCAGWIRGFDKQILEMLNSRNPAIHREAVIAAGRQEVDAAWPHVAALAGSAATEKSLRLAAIEAASGIRPREAKEHLADLADSEDEEIADAVSDAMIAPEFDEDAEFEDGEDEEDDL